MVLVTYSCIPDHPKTEYLQTVMHYCPFQSQGLTRLVGQFSLEVSHDIAVRWQGGTGVTLRLILVWSQEGFLAHISGFPGFPLSFSLHSLSSSVGLSIHMVVWHDCGLKIANSHTSSMALDFQERIMKLLCQLNLLLLWGHAWLYEHMDCSTPGFPVLHSLSECAQIHVLWVSDSI